MIKSGSHRLPYGRTASAILLSLALSVPAVAQNRTSRGTGSGDYSIFEVSPFAGFQWFKDRNGHELEAGPLFGIRFTQDFSRHVGLEEGFSFAFNDVRLANATFESTNYQLSVMPVFHLTPRESRVRPFVTVGPGITWYRPESSTLTSRTGVVVPLSMKYGPALVFGGGVKFNATQRVGFRFDARGMWTQTPHFGLPDFASGPAAVYLPRGTTELALQATLGISFRFGHRAPPSPPPPPPTPAPVEPPKPVPPPSINIEIAGIDGARDVCPGDDLRLTVRARGWPQDQPPAYEWLVNGRPAPGSNAASFSVPTQSASGTQSVSVRVTAAGASRTSDAVTVRIKDYRPPTVQFTVSPSTIRAGEKLPLNATASESECGGPATIVYSASEGTVTGNVFDSSGVSFDMSNRSRLQTKVVTLTATATDRKGGTGSARADVTVTLRPESRRLDDIAFPPGSSRVNNCAKRLLIEELTALLRDDPNSRVILIGHRDGSETGKAAAELDRQRVLNAAAVLSAGTGICPQLDLSRVKLDWVGTDQSSPTRPSLCGASTTVKEKGGQAVSASDPKAQFRRVEIWFVPGGADMPAQMSGLKDAPQVEIRAKGCPK
jgi:outer membrane protein OmpA-like peptidoglycan-associated protein